MRASGMSESSHSVESYALHASRSKDLTIHLELNVVEDIEADLDEFCRLAKLGNFDAAKGFFADNLQGEMSNPYVFMQYAQMLLNIGDYAAVRGLRNPPGLNKVDMLRINWTLLKLLADLHLNGASIGQVNDVTAEAIRLLDTGSLKNRLGSTENNRLPQVQILSLVPRLSAKRYPSSNGINVSHIFVWASIYKHLLSEGRVWDFRDLFVAFLLNSTQEATCLQFLLADFGSPSLMDTLVGDWMAETFDEPISLALLDIIAFLCLGSISTREKYAAVQHCLEHSRGIALSIAENDADLLLTGPYLRWSLAKARVATYSERSILKEPAPPSVSPGRLFYRSEAIDVPLYAPTQSELVDWTSLVHSSHANSNIRTVLNATKQLGDYNTESMSRQMLVYRSKQPLQQFDELVALQKSRQRDMHGCLHTILAKYPICQDDIARERLRDEILAVGNPENFPITLQEIRTRVLRAISNEVSKAVPSPHQEDIHNELQDRDVENQTNPAGPSCQDLILKLPSRSNNEGDSVPAASVPAASVPAASVLADLAATNNQTAPKPEVNEYYDYETSSEESFADASIHIHSDEDGDRDSAYSYHHSKRTGPPTFSASPTESGTSSSGNFSESSLSKATTAPTIFTDDSTDIYSRGKSR